MLSWTSGGGGFGFLGLGSMLTELWKSFCEFVVMVGVISGGGCDDVVVDFCLNRLLWTLGVLPNTERG